MTDIAYMPGCTLKTSGRNFDETTRKFLELFGVKLNELPDWCCCGTTYSLASDNLMYHLAPARNLVKAAESGSSKLLVPCAMCYNTLRRAQDLILNDKEKRDKLNDFMDKEKTKISGDEVRVMHLVSFLKEDVGFDTIKAKITPPPAGLKAAVYYGCMLLRPNEIAIDKHPEDPSIMEKLLEACGIETVYFPFKTECCGSYQVVNEKRLVVSRTAEIVKSAFRNGAELIITSCPLCYFNLDAHQEELSRGVKYFNTVPVMYISQLLALLAGVVEGSNYSLHAVDPRPLLRKKGLLA
jgi:heterodisulfide reductase subunit B